MSAQQPLWKRKIAQLAEYDIQHHASLLKWTTLIIWACSLAAEVGTFAANKKLPKKEKSFIIKQELTAGGISLAVMYLLADRFEKAGEWLVRQGKLLPKDLPQAWRNKASVEKVLNADPDFLKQAGKDGKVWIEKLAGFRKGVSVAAGTVGTILAFNIATPIISNKIASYFQNRSGAPKLNPTHSQPTNQPASLRSPANGLSTARQTQAVSAAPYYRYNPFQSATPFYR